jgi:phosphoenolpyruvate-protein kinase (PTS system EI component)
MTEQLLAGLPASPGRAAGPVRRLGGDVAADAAVLPEADRCAELERARAALAAAGAELGALAARLRAAGRADEADIVETGVLMAADPALEAALEEATAAGTPAAAAIVAACEVHAAAIASLGDELLAARADDVRSLGRRAARIATGGDGAATGDGAPAILVADDLGPADVAELEGAVAGVALAGGGPSAHAAVVARGLGIPMVVGLGPAVLAAEPGALAVLDGGAGEIALRPGADRLASARAEHDARRAARSGARAARGLPAVTRDGRRIRVLVNAATAAEVRAGLDAGAEGAGLIRSELAFLDAPGWPDEEAHRRALAPVLAPLAGRTATVRVLDFGADKTPPFLRGTAARGLTLLLEAPGALSSQLRAIADTGRDTRLRVLLPLVDDADQVQTTRALLEAACAAAGAPVPQLGAMIETVAAAHAAAAIAGAADFLSIGTNDLTASALGADRFAAAGRTERATHDPRVLALVRRTTRAAAAAGTFAEVCGEAASEPVMVPLLAGLGVEELSVGAARVGATRGWVRELDAAACERAAERALAAPGPDAVAAIARALLAQPGDAGAEDADRGGRVVALGTQP